MLAARTKWHWLLSLGLAASSYLAAGELLESRTGTFIHRKIDNSSPDG